jgi:hypothetical protein
MRSIQFASVARQRGAAALLVVVVLFFILALVTAYAGRNLIFEQRSAVNNQRATQAFEMAESGIEFAIALLNSGRVSDMCLPTNDVTKGTFRQRHMGQQPGGEYSISVAQGAQKPTCLLLPSGSTCSCPSGGPPDLIVPVGLAPTFQLSFDTAGILQPGVVRAVSRGCSSIGQQCYGGVGNAADAVAEISVLLGLNSALATPPSAALTARGAVNLNGGSISVINTDVPSGGITIDAGGDVTNRDNARLTSAPGTPGSASLRALDPSLSDLPNGDRLFVSLFGMDRVTYRTQPAAVRVVCGGDCDSAIANEVSANPGRVIWVQGPATIDSNIVLGSTANPVVLVVQGNLTVAANLQLFGVLYLYDNSDSNTWSTNAGSTLIQGAVVAEGALSVVGSPAITFDPGVLRTINLTQGSMVRIPGSWRDFSAGS